MKKFISLLVAVVVALLPLMPLSAVKSEAAQIDFTCGVNATWSLDEYGVMTVSGTGEMYDYNFLTPPWQDFKSSIKKIIIEEGITKIGASAFRSLPAVTDLHIASSVEIIGNAAVQSLEAFDRITIGENSKLRQVSYRHLSSQNGIIQSPTARLFISEMSCMITKATHPKKSLSTLKRAPPQYAIGLFTVKV